MSESEYLNDCVCLGSCSCSEPMDSTWPEPRVGVSIRYMPTAVRQHYGQDEAMLVRGVDSFGHFHLHGPPGPDGDLSSTAIEEFERLMLRRQVVLGEAKRRGPGVGVDIDDDSATFASASSPGGAARL